MILGLMISIASLLAVTASLHFRVAAIEDKLDRTEEEQGDE